MKGTRKVYTMYAGFSSWSSVGESELGYALWNNRILSASNHSNFKAVLGDIKTKLTRLEKASFLLPPFRASFCSYKNVQTIMAFKGKLWGIIHKSLSHHKKSYLELSKRNRLRYQPVLKCKKKNVTL